jgi:hypothetical protein
LIPDRAPARTGVFLFVSDGALFALRDLGGEMIALKPHIGQQPVIEG